MAILNTISKVVAAGLSTLLCCEILRAQDIQQRDIILQDTLPAAVKTDLRRFDPGDPLDGFLGRQSEVPDRRRSELFLDPREQPGQHQMSLGVSPSE